MSFDRVSNLFYTFITQFSTTKEADDACVRGQEDRAQGSVSEVQNGRSDDVIES